MSRMPTLPRYKLLRRAMAGVSLIEMMVSLTIGLLIIAGIGYAYLGTKQNFRSQDALSRMQEGARTAFEIMAKDIRMAGFRGCPPNTSTGDINILAVTSDWDKNFLDKNLSGGSIGRSLIGYEKASASAWPSFPAGVTGVVGNVIAGDALTVLHADNSKEYFVASHDTAASQLTLTVNHDLQQGEILVVSKADCSGNAVFQKTNACTLSSGSCGDKIVQHGSSGTAATPLGFPSGTVDTYGAGSRIFRLSAVTYHIRRNLYQEPSLYRQVLGTSGTAPNNAPQELVEGVQDMQLSYGVDVTADGAVDCYIVAGNVSDGVNDCGTASADWSNVLGVRIGLLMVSRSDEKGITSSPQQYALDMNGDGDVADAGETVVPTDNLLRKVFITTIAVKNRL
jgi:type IV pilus assembly protein PilW